MEYKNKKVATTEYIAGQKDFLLPLELWPKLELTIYNSKTNLWRKNEFDILISPKGNKKKTDKTIRITYD